MELVDHAEVVVLKSWSAIMGWIAGFLGIVAIFQPYISVLQGILPDKTFLVLSAACALSVPLARIVKQPALRAATPQTTSPGEPGAATDGGTPS